MRSNSNVVMSWLLGKKASNRNMSTDGKNLYSYKLKIGYTKELLKYVYDYTGKDMVSRTTSRHVGIAKHLYAVIVNVPA